MNFKIADSCPKVIIVQSSPSGDYDYSEYLSINAAWDAEKDEAWVNQCAEEGEDPKREFYESMSIFTPEEALIAAKEGYSWPLNLGFVEKIEDVDD